MISTTSASLVFVFGAALGLFLGYRLKRALTKTPKALDDVMRQFHKDDKHRLAFGSFNDCGHVLCVQYRHLMQVVQAARDP